LLIADVVFPIPLDKSFDYLVPETLAGTLRPGHRVFAPLGPRRTQVGVVTGVRALESGDRPPEKLKYLTSLMEASPALSVQDLALADWMAKRVFCSRGEAVFGVLPVGQRRPPKRTVAPRVLRDPTAPYGAPKPAALTEDQAAAMAALKPAVEAGGFAPFLLHGVNASGKTEVYIHLIESVLAAGRTALFLVPEIGLTPQTEGHLTARFKDGVGVWHSELSAGERWRLWEDVKAGRIRVVLGPRSALFLPLTPLGLIVVDEEHDPSYKSDAAPHFHARDTAVEKARLHGCPVILGSATPSMESLQAARQGTLTLVRMGRRVHDRPFPQVTIVDMKKDKGWYMSDILVNALRDRLAKKEQTLLFLNRRGYATQMFCKACEWEARCPHCQVSLVYHQKNADGELPLAPGAAGTLRCHTCDHRQDVPARCPECRGEMVAYRGRGTQRVEGDLKLLFPEARLLRWDRDTTQKKAAHQRAFQAVRAQGEIDIIIGTQMIAQGLDFPRVTLGGILDADRSLRFPDFRAGERTFHLLSQMAGRVGRGETPGDVVLQTRHPEHYAVAAARTFDYDAFAESELAFRREMGYPPFVRLASVLLRGKNDARVEKAAADMISLLDRSPLPPGCQALGPAPAFHHHREGFAQWQILLKAAGDGLGSLISLVKGYDLPSGVSFTVDADPEDLA
jgi:primosomal protein N' (replication factor Y) (superfamily II helicase)